MTAPQRLNRIDNLEAKIVSGFMPDYKKVRQILSENKRQPKQIVKSNIPKNPWGDNDLFFDTVDGTESALK